MSSEASAIERETKQADDDLTADRVAEYLRANPEFFLQHDEILADLSLPHESGKAISLLERQVNILRERGIEARQKLNNLLQNARNNDQLFDTTRNLILALLRAENIDELVRETLDQLGNQDNIDACAFILVEHEDVEGSAGFRVASPNKLKQDFNDVFRLRRTHCGPLDERQLEYLFKEKQDLIRSTAVCPIVSNSETLALLALGNRSDNYFNIHLDTLFLDFIGHVIGAVLYRQLIADR